MKRNATARTNHYGTVPREQIARSRFPMPQTRKQAFNASELIPIFCEEVLPGDVWRHRDHSMARLATPIAPVVDDLALETGYFYVPNRILWPTIAASNGDLEGWETFITGFSNKSISNITNLLVSLTDTGGNPTVLPGSVMDHFGIRPQVYTVPMNVTAFPLLAYLTIHREWFRDQNLQEQYEWPKGINPIPTWQIEQTSTATQWDQMPLRVNKIHDYFTASLPWPQKGDPVLMPLGSTAPVITGIPHLTGAQTGLGLNVAATGLPVAAAIALSSGGAGGALAPSAVAAGAGVVDTLYPTNLYADLADATGATLNAMRVAVTTQQFLELDARGGSRYVENLMGHWGVRSPDYRLQRPEYLGGSKIPITVNPIAQTNATTTETQLGNLASEMHASGSGGNFTYAATEHGYIIGLAWARAKPTYQQGTRRHWIGHNTRLDYPDPIFANIGEQAVQTIEIFTPADLAPANPIWGYQERYGEMRVIPNEITGVLRSDFAQTMDWWHYAEDFTAAPGLNDTFITDKTQETLARSLATDPEEIWQAQIILDILHDNQVARLLPTYGVPGLTRF